VNTPEASVANKVRQSIFKRNNERVFIHMLLSDIFILVTGSLTSRYFLRDRSSVCHSIIKTLAALHDLQKGDERFKATTDCFVLQNASVSA